MAVYHERMNQALVWVSLVGLVSCDKLDAPNVPSASEARTVPAFHAIELRGVVGADLTVGKPASVQITADNDKLNRVITEVKDGVLVIDTKGSGSFGHLHAAVTAPDIDAIALTGTADLSATGIASPNLAISVSGTGMVNATGKADTLHITIGGSGHLTAGDLAAKDVTIDIGGTGSATLQATQSVDARISGTGSVTVHGHPAAVHKSVGGTGSIRVD